MYKNRKSQKLSIAFIIGFCLTFASLTDALADPVDQLSGYMTTTINQESVLLPMLKTDIHADIQGNLVEVNVTQHFHNPTNLPINSTYLFPLNKDAAVHSMVMHLGDRKITAIAQEKQQAKQTR